MPDGLYDTDLLAWSREQADRLRRVAKGERVNDLDWANVIEEIESVGRSDMRAVRSLFERAIEHALKVVAWPNERAVEHWTDETWNFLSQARSRFERSMMQHFDLADLYGQAVRDVRRVARTYDATPRPTPAEPPFTLDELCDPEFIAHDLIARIHDASPPT